MGAQGRRETCGLAAELPPWHGRCHGSRVWCTEWRLAGKGHRSATGLAACGKGCPLHPTPRPKGAGVFEGKQLGCGVTAARRQASRLAGLVCGMVLGWKKPSLGNGPRGLWQGTTPCTPDCAPWARRGVGRHAAWLRSYRRGTEGATARGFGVLPCRLALLGRTKERSAALLIRKPFSVRSTEKSGIAKGSALCCGVGGRIAPNVIPRKEKEQCAAWCRE